MQLDTTGLEQLIQKERRRRSEGYIKAALRRVHSRQNKSLLSGDCYRGSQTILLWVVAITHTTKPDFCYIIPVFDAAQKRAGATAGFEVVGNGWAPSLYALPLGGHWAHKSELTELVDYRPDIGEVAKDYISRYLTVEKLEQLLRKTEQE